MDNELARYGLYMDGMSKKIRLLNPDYHQLTSDLVEECMEYLRDARGFKSSSANELTVILNLKSLTERQKMEMIAKRNKLMSVSAQKQVLRNKMYKELKEKRIKLERTKQQREALNQLKVEHEEMLRILCRR